MWSETEVFVKERVKDAKHDICSSLKLLTGILFDCPGGTGGNTNSGPNAIKFLGTHHRKSVCDQIHSPTDRETYRELLQRINVIMTISQSVDTTKTVDISKFKLYCYETVTYILQNLPWIYIYLPQYTLCYTTNGSYFP